MRQGTFSFFSQLACPPPRPDWLAAPAVESLSPRNWEWGLGSAFISDKFTNLSCANICPANVPLVQGVRSIVQCSRMFSEHALCPVPSPELRRRDTGLNLRISEMLMVTRCAFQSGFEDQLQQKWFVKKDRYPVLTMHHPSGGRGPGLYGNAL